MGGMLATLWLIGLCLSLLGGAIGVTLMLSSFAIILRHADWQAALYSTPGGKWSIARKLMAAGAMMNVLFLSSAFLLVVAAKMFLPNS